MLSRVARLQNLSWSFASPLMGWQAWQAWRAWRVWALAFVIIGVTSCERVPSKSDYVSAQVTKMCAGESGDSLRACRLAVINQFKDTPLEELQRRFPKPEPWSRPSSCG